MNQMFKYVSYFFRVTCWLVFEKILNNMLLLEKVVDIEELIECIRGDPVI